MNNVNAQDDTRFNSGGLVGVTNYVDVGTAEDWFEYNDRPVIFCDIDGTLIKAQPKAMYHEAPEALEENVKTLLKYQDKGSQFALPDWSTKQAQDTGRTGGAHTRIDLQVQ